MAVIDAKTVKELREKTGAGMMDCKEALAACGGDAEKAVEHLRKKGMASADKKAGRAALQGTVCAFVDGACGALVEVNCETDFVARTEVFQGYVTALARQAASGKPVDPGSAKEITAKVGENIKVGRTVCLEKGKSAHPVMGSYIHMGGKIGVLVELGCSAAPKDSAAVATLAEDLAMQVAAARPLCVRRSEVEPALVEKEKEIYRAQVAESKKPANVVERIVEGKLDKFYQSICLEEQEYIKDPAGKLKVRDHVKAVSGAAGAEITILRFARFEIGEGQEKGSC